VRQSTGEGGVEKGPAELVGFAAHGSNGHSDGVEAGELLFKNPDNLLLFIRRWNQNWNLIKLRLSDVHHATSMRLSLHLIETRLNEITVKVLIKKRLDFEDVLIQDRFWSGPDVDP
jgi:hypothetical protein